MTESRSTPDHAKHHVVAVFEDVEHVRKALDELRGAGFDESALSVLGRGDESEDVPETAGPEDFADAADTAGAGVVKGSAVGGAGGALAGVLGGALLSVAVPGLGTAVGIGMMTGAAAGGAAGATSGSLWSGFERMWDMGYRDLIAGGGLLVGVHTDEADEADRAQRVLAGLGPVRIELLDAHGEVVRAR